MYSIMVLVMVLFPWKIRGGDQYLRLLVGIKCDVL